MDNKPVSEWTTDELYEYVMLVAKGPADRLSEVAAEVRKRLDLYDATRFPPTGE